MKLLNDDMAVRNMALAAVLSDPLEFYRRRVDYANTITTSIDEMHFALGDNAHTADETLAAAATANRELLSGDEGETAIIKYASLLTTPFQDGCWDLFDITATEDSLTNAILLLTQALAETWRRLVHPFQCYPWLLLTGATSPGPEELAQCLSHARTRQTRCRCCVDDYFTDVILQAAQDGVPASQIASFRYDTLATIRVSSVNVECQHVYYQEVSKDVRTRCKVPSAIQTSTYQAALRMGHARTKRLVVRKHDRRLVQVVSC
jgi:hypothetical protein